MRFTVGRLPLRRDDAWARALPRASAAWSARSARPLLGAYGYPLSPLTTEAR